jgi:hypothetical protein
MLIEISSNVNNKPRKIQLRLRFLGKTGHNNPANENVVKL